MVPDAAARTLLQRFVAFLRRNIAAVQSTIELPRIASPVEDRIRRLNMIKRTIYERAAFPSVTPHVLLICL